MKNLILIFLLSISISVFSQVQYKAVKSTDTIVSVKTMRHHRHTIDSTNKEIRKAKDTVKAQDTIIKKQADIINKAELKENILGKMSFTFLLSVYIFSFLGMFLRWSYKAKQGIKKDETSPDTFNFKYWIKNNLTNKLINALFNFAALFIIFRFAGEIYSLTLTMIVAFFIGFSLDLFIDKLMAMDFSTFFKTKTPSN
jgi:hypothetical protein